MRRCARAAGSGQWRGVEAERLLDSPLIAVGLPNAARRLLGRDAAALAGVTCRGNPVASFNDAGLVLQAAEQDLGLALARELLVADALRDGRLMRLSPIALTKDQA